MEKELDEINTDSHKKTFTRPSNPEEVLKFIEEHEKKSNSMIDQGHDLIKKIKEMNQEISSELQTHNILISKLDNNMNSLNENLKKNSNKIEEILKNHLLNNYNDNLNNYYIIFIIYLINLIEN